MAFFCLSVIVFIYVGFGSCASYVQAWLGEAPGCWSPLSRTAYTP